MKVLYRAQERAIRGTYWDIGTGQRVDMEEPDVLPGSGVTYVKVSPAGMLLLGPLLGLVFAIFLPLIGIVMFLKLAGQRLLGPAARFVLRGVSFGWRPGEAYLEGKKRGEEKDEGRQGEEDVGRNGDSPEKPET